MAMLTLHGSLSAHRASVTLTGHAAAGTYDFTQQVNACLSYTEIFTPQYVKNVNHNLRKPITGEDHEAV